MSYNQDLIAEMKMEAASTRKLLAVVPLDKSDWKPHDKSMKLGSLATHIAELSGWVTMILTTTELDLAKMDYKPNIPTSNAELVEKFDNKLSEAITTLEKALPSDFEDMWTLRRGEHVMFTMQKKAVLRAFSLSHLYHHRGQLSVYLRLLDVPIPGMYGPSADDIAAMAAQAAAVNN